MQRLIPLEPQWDNTNMSSPVPAVEQFVGHTIVVTLDTTCPMHSLRLKDEVKGVCEIIVNANLKCITCKVRSYFVGTS